MLCASRDLWRQRYSQLGRVEPTSPISAIDQAMTLIAIANHLGDDAIQELFANDPIPARALPLLAAEHWFD